VSSSLLDLVPLVAKPTTEEQQDVVDAREFDLTQIAKKLVVMIPLVLTAVFVALKEVLHVEAVTEPAAIAGALGVTGVALLTAGFVACADILGRAYVTKGAPAPDAAEPASEPESGKGQEAERERLDRVASEERARLDRLAEEERVRKDAVAEAERERLDRVAEDERARRDAVAEDERKRKEAVAEDERKRLDLAAAAARNGAQVPETLSK
jgi:hypothetical protein